MEFLAISVNTNSVHKYLQLVRTAAGNRLLLSNPAVMCPRNDHPGHVNDILKIETIAADN